MNVEELASFALQRVTAYEGLAIDAATWTDAHTYHQTAQRLHVRALHGWGIVTGLGVTPADGRTVLLQPGVAIDREGNIIRVAQPVRLAMPQGEKGTVCFVLRFVEAPVASGNSSPPSRVNEFFNFLVSPLPVRPNDIEVGRVELADTTSPIRLPANEWEPGAQELDRRFRRQLHLPTGETLTIGHLALADPAAQVLHRQGLVNMVRELRATAPFVVQYVGSVRAEAAVGYCNMLYMSGAGPLRLTPREGAQLLAFLRGGGMLFAEPCVEQETKRQENGRFVATFQRLMADLKQELEPVGPGHPAFGARYIFGAPPDGLGGHAPLLAKGNALLNPNDYGCIWQGGATGKPAVREQIRSAVELGVNICWQAAEQASHHTASAESQPQVTGRAG